MCYAGRRRNPRPHKLAEKRQPNIFWQQHVYRFNLEWTHGLCHSCHRPAPFFSKQVMSRQQHLFQECGLAGLLQRLSESDCGTREQAAESKTEINVAR
jgi:hypothetical protein